MLSAVVHWILHCLQHSSSFVFCGKCVTLCFLAVPSIFVGYVTKDMIVGVGSDFFGSAIYNNPKTLHVFDAEFVEFFYKTLPVALSLTGATLSFILYNFQPSILFNLKTSFLGRKVYTFLNKKWFFDKLYNELFGQFFFKFGYTVSYKAVDRGAFEIMGPAGLSSVLISSFDGVAVLVAPGLVVVELLAGPCNSNVLHCSSSAFSTVDDMMSLS